VSRAPRSTSDFRTGHEETRAAARRGTGRGRKREQAEEKSKSLSLLLLSSAILSSLSTFAPPLLYWKGESLYWRLLSRGIFTPTRLGHSQTFLLLFYDAKRPNLAPRKRSVFGFYFVEATPSTPFFRLAHCIPRDQSDVSLSVRLFARDLTRSVRIATSTFGSGPIRIEQRSSSGVSLSPFVLHTRDSSSISDYLHVHQLRTYHHERRKQ